MLTAQGTVHLAAGETPPWLLYYAIGECKFYLETPVMVTGDTWEGPFYYDPAQKGSYVAYVMVVNAADDAHLHDIADKSRSPFIIRLPPSARVAHVTIRCCG
jgi:hypothetical protein